MRSSLAAAAAATLALTPTLALAGADYEGPAWKVAATLDCPAGVGDLTRVSQSPDGQWCDYEGRRGDTVRLRILPLGGRSPSEALAPARAALHDLVPVYREPIPASYGGEQGDRADVDLPFLHVHAVGDRADVRLFGIHVASQGDNADVKVGFGHKHSVVHAGLKGAEVVADDVGRTNASLVYVLAANRREPSGYRAVGYVAKGPVSGPMVVAEFRSRDKGHEHTDGDHGDIGRLIDRNIRR
ncbi:MAG TPA: hypothetical protein VGC92_16170 [Phenylobacterium sp.]